MKTLYLDLETIPTRDFMTIMKIADTIKPPGTMKKPETIAAWVANEKQQAVDDAISKTSLNGAYGHICCLGWAFDDEPVQTVIWPRDVENEAAAIYTFKSIVEGKTNAQPTIVGHNVVEFDIRFLWQRAFVLGIRMPPWFPRNPRPWDREVFDTMTAFAGSRNTISMDNLCLALGIEGKTGMDGSMVAAAWDNEEYELIASYCADDVERTRKIHKKMLIALGEVA